ncbi:putative glycosyltransferase [Apilactobacillus kunkeei]|uniref:Putative bactoprenol glucosyl transferase-like protein n=1 Tax=Apilactobacillus kunkeei TaxID=148814 RepID=A0A0P7KAA5_9LACO|nr:glycosyltransferase family 2 protein [Apilactobacillus kunkeei]KPN83933.1 putative bactoprenol glucosyl transferase-like protein [Apilactobacillus kunkeei]KPN84150.1 putative bactoprenol glucosyl transferase-like protein [Apilactobacillus kunkeei]MCK8620286.1 glycosyltransferase family 2 protein [Apilactobacillus kunkeei]MCK8626640.1 glycosyltransferase family 2 protein [Apilactobacillus kunkeei]MCK8635978.1 glycosyltransferase family 2 protein [Apilactobacillus kunkeei]
MPNKTNKISIVLPVYNEEAGIKNTIEVLENFVECQIETYEIIFVDDGSVDSSVDIIRHAQSQYENIRLVEFSRNFGHQLAITAGIRYAKGDAVVVMDADLQDPPSVIPNMIEKWQEGFDVVYGKRLIREGESFFKRFSAKAFYRVMRKVANVDIPLDTGDFRLMDRKVVDALSKLNEPEPFVRGLVSWVGFKQTAVTYERQERNAGVTKYPLTKMIRLASDGITSFSEIPLKIVNYTGFISIIAGIIYGLITVFTGISTLTFAISLMCVLSGMIMLALGIIGDYLYRTFDASKHRPQYVVSNSYGFNNQHQNIATIKKQHG